MSNWLRNLENWFSGKVHEASRQVASAPREKTLLEICKAIQEDVLSRILAQDRGLRSFPYTRIEVNVFAKDEEQRAVYDAVLGSDPSFSDRIRSLLLEEGCRLREMNIDVRVTADEAVASQEKPYTLRFSRDAAPVVDSRRPAAMLKVIKGEAEQMEVPIESDRINIGRLREVQSTNGTVLRVNHLAFAETETAIAREHAFVQWDPSSGRFMLFDHLSGSRGTRLFRSGQSITVPKGVSKGTVLQDKDEIHLGTARVLLRIQEKAS